MSVMSSLYTYFKDIDLVKSFHDMVYILLYREKVTVTYSQNKPVSITIINDYIDDAVTGGPAARLKKDELPRCIDWLDEVDIIQDKGKKYMDKINYFANEFYNMVSDKSSFSLDGFFDALINGISVYTDNNCDQIPKKLIGCSVAATKIKEYLEKSKFNRMTSEDSKRTTFSYSIYSVLYFLENGIICQRLSEEINGLDFDRKEFTDEVLSKFGCSGKPGMYSVYHLADREDPEPNSIALYEAAELEYYGKGFSKTPNYEGAFNYYLKAAHSSRYNPLAGWALGYMYYYYHDDKKELKDAYIPQMDFLDKISRKILALNYIRSSFECGCFAAANVLASLVKDNDIPQIHKIGLLDEEKYLLIASSGNYVYAKNNLYKYYKEKAAMSDSQTEKTEYLRKAIFYIKESADLGEPWAMNQYALYLHGQDQIKEAFGYFLRGDRALQDWSTFNLLKKYYLPSLAHELYFFKHDISIKTINALIDKCLNSENAEIVADTQKLTEKYREVIKNAQ